jgi:hypothetical protein
MNGYLAVMAYILNLFTPETWAAFRNHDAEVSGFRVRQRRVARERIKPGDVFLCYLVRLSRWCGALEITSDAFQDDTPIFADPDPFVIRFRVTPLVLLDPEESVPIFEPKVWKALSETREAPLGSTVWTGYFRSSLRQIEDKDGEFLLSLLREQQEERQTFPFTDRDKRQLARKRKIRALDREVTVEVPDDEDEVDTISEPAAVETAAPAETRQSIQMQAKVAQIGVEMGFRVWVPRGDRVRVLELTDGRPSGSSAKYGYPPTYRCAGRKARESPARNPATSVFASRSRTAV